MSTIVKCLGKGYIEKAKKIVREGAMQSALCWFFKVQPHSELVFVLCQKKDFEVEVELYPISLVLNVGSTCSRSD